MTSNPVLSPEIAHPVFDLTGGNQWDQNPDPVQNGTLQEWSEPPPPYQQIPISTASNGSSPTIYNNVPNFNGNGNITYPPNSINMNQHPSTSYERNGTNNSIYTINGVRPPRNMLLPGMVRHNGYPTYHNGNTNYANIANNRYVHRAQGWVPTTKPSNGVKKQKRNRTAFTSHQMMELEQEYTRTRYLDRNRRIELSEILNLNQRTIKIWFQNRRMKEKKDRAESLEESEEVSTSESERSPDLSDIPLLIQDQYPVSVTASELYNRAGLYIDPMSYPITTQAGVLQPTLPQVPIQMPQDFIEYAPVENTYESIPLRQVHLQVQQYDNAFENGVQDLQQSDSGTASAQSSLNESWDLSWIRSIQIDEDI